MAKTLNPKKKETLVSAPQEPPKTDAQHHYEELTSFFKYLVGVTLSAITILLAVGGVMIISDRTNYNEQVEKFKSDALDKIGSIRDSAYNIAKTEAVRSIKEVYEKENMSELVKEIIKTDPAIKSFAGQEVQIVQFAVEKNIDDLARVSAAIGSIQYDIRKGLDDLIDVSEHCDNNVIRDYANDLLKRTIADAEDRYKEGLSKERLDEIEQNLKEQKIIILDADDLFIQGVINYIETGESFSGVFCCFAYLKKSGIDVEFFDFDAVTQYKRKKQW